MGLRSQNNPIASFRDVFSATGKDAVSPAPIPPLPSGLTATGGIISDYTSGSNVYRAHVFTSSGTFTVSSDPGSYGSSVEVLLIGGGGGGGHDAGGGGGAGAFYPNPSVPISTSPGTYPIIIGAGGLGQDSPDNPGGNGDLSLIHI